MNEPTRDQRQKERAVVSALLMDTCTISLFVVAGAVSGSLTAVDEARRGMLGDILECFTLVL